MSLRPPPPPPTDVQVSRLAAVLAAGLTVDTDGKHEDEKPGKTPYDRPSKEKRKEDVVSRESTIEALNAKFPLNTVVTVDSFKQLLPFIDEIAASMVPDAPTPIYLWFFSCVPLGDDVGIKVLCAKPDQLLNPEAAINQLKARELVRKVGETIAWSDKDSYGDRCGTFNCFNVIEAAQTTSQTTETTPRAVWQRVLANALITRLQGTDDVAALAFRAPRYQAVTLRPTSDIRTELKTALLEAFFTLHMAQKRVTPPILGMCPTFLLSQDASSEQVPVATGMVYFTAYGWRDLYGYLGRNVTTMSSVQRSNLGIAILESVLKTSNEEFLLLDVKTPNMVVREIGGRFDCRMIDFGGDFTVNINSKASEQTSKDCIFFINGLLLLNQVTKDDLYKWPGGERPKPPFDTSKKQEREAMWRQGDILRELILSVFRPLFLKIAARWVWMKKTSRLQAFCALLADDDRYGPGLPKHLNGDVYWEKRILQLVDAKTFWGQVRQTFYVMVAHYGKDRKMPNPAKEGAQEFRDFLGPEAAGAPAIYIENLLVDIASEWMRTLQVKEETLRDEVDSLGP